MSSQQVLQALDVMHTGADKKQAAQFLEDFQRGNEAWTTCHELLADINKPDQAKIFAAQTLKSKITWDFYQVPESSRMGLKTSLIHLLESNVDKRVVARHLSVALANLALQFIGWQNVVPEMVSKFGSKSEKELMCLLEFLKVLPEELQDSKRTPLSDEDFRDRCSVLVEDNAKNVLELLVQYAHQAKGNEVLVFECLNSWINEVGIAEIANSPILSLLFDGLNNEETFEPAAECVCSMIRETKDVIDTIDTIKILYPRVAALRPQISKCKDDSEAFRGYTKIFAGAGEAWHVLIAQNPSEFRQLVEAIAECTAFDDDLDVVQYTFYFWYSLKQMLVMPKYEESRRQLADVYEKLIDVIIHHLRYPEDGNTSDNDVFNGDKEEEEKFRSFRHEMGDTLKDCCSVVGSEIALKKAYGKVYAGLQNNSTWQEIEAPLFSMRAMAREVDVEENEILPAIMKMLVQLPEHEKIRYAATLVLGRYTEWTAEHPDYLDFQLQYITNGFGGQSRSVMSAAAQALMHFCQDCSSLLTGYLEQLHSFFSKALQELDVDALYEVADGISHVIVALPSEEILPALQHFAQPVVSTLLPKVNEQGNEEMYREIADKLEFLTILVSIVRPSGETVSSPTSDFVQNVFVNLINPLVNAHGKQPYVAERSCKFIKTSLHSCSIGLEPILAQIAELLVSQFESTQYGCYLWVSGALVREFGYDFRNDPTTSTEVRDAVWQFVCRQSQSFFRFLSSSKAEDLPDLVEDFFRLMGDVLQYMPYKLLSTSEIYQPAFEASLVALTLEQVEPVGATLHYLQDFFAFGGNNPPFSYIHEDSNNNPTNTPQVVQENVVKLAIDQGHLLCARIIMGLIYTFPRDCINDASSLLITLIQLVPQDRTIEWLNQTINLLPEGSVGDQEKQNLLSKIATALQSGDMKRVKTLLRDFTALYSRRNVTPRSRNVSGISLSQFNYDK